MGKRLDQYNQTRDRVADVYISDKDRIEKLRLILCRDMNREVTYEEAREIGSDLIEFYKILAQGKRIVLGGLKNKDRLKEG